MQYRPGTPVDRFFTEEMKDAILSELEHTDEGPLFQRFYRLCRANLKDENNSDEFNDRLADFYCQLVDKDLTKPLCALLQIDPFMGIYAKEERELTPLCYAIYKGKVSVAKQMIDVMAPNHLITVESYDPGTIAIMEDQKEIVRYLLEKGCPSNLFAGHYTALQFAVKEMKSDIVQMLVEELHQDVNDTNCCKSPPLTLAVDNDDPELVSYLLGQEGVSVNHVDEDGKYPLDHGRSEEVIQLLEEAGAMRAPAYQKYLCMAIEAVFYDADKALDYAQQLVSYPDAVPFNELGDLFQRAAIHAAPEILKLLLETGMVSFPMYQEEILQNIIFGVLIGDYEKPDKLCDALRVLVEHGYENMLQLMDNDVEWIWDVLKQYAQTLSSTHEKVLLGFALVYLKRLGLGFPSG